jgi:hypothetical protein
VTALQTLLNQELNHRIVEVMAAGVARMVFGDPGLVGDHRHLEELVLQLLAEPERLRAIPVAPPPYWELGDAGGGPVDPGAGQVAEVAPESEERSCRFLGFDAQGGLQLIGGLVVGLIALYSSYDHFNVFGRVISLNQQRGVCFIIASLAVVAVVAEGFCAAVAQLASRSRGREEDRRREEALARSRDANEAARERNRRARQEAAQFRRARVEADAQQAQLAYLARPSAASREQLGQVLSKLSSSEVRALFEDEALEKALGLRP